MVRQSNEERVNPKHVSQCRDDLDTYCRRQKLKFTKTHRWTKPGVAALHKSIRKFLIPLIGMDPEISSLYTYSWEVVRNKFVETCGQSEVIDMNRAAQEMSSSKDPGSLYTRAGYNSKMDVYGSSRFLQSAQWVWLYDLPRGRFKPFCDVNGKTEILELGKDGRTVYCVDAMTILFQKMLFHDQHEKYRRSQLSQMWAWLGKSGFGSGSQDRFDWITHGGKVREVYDFDVKKMEANMRTREMLELSRLHYEALAPQWQTVDMWRRVRALYCGMAECPFLVPDEHNRMQVFWKGANGFGGNPSGQICTALDNSLFDMVLMCFVYTLECAIRGEETSWSWFWLNHHGTIMGDDLQLSVTPEADYWWKRRWKNVGVAYMSLLYFNKGIVIESTNPMDENGEVLPTDVFSARFCAMQFTQFTKPWKWVSFIMDRDRMLSSVQQGDPLAPPERHLERFNGIRNVTWGDMKTRTELANWRNEFVQRIEKEKPYKIGQENWERAKAGWLSDSELYRLYTDTSPKRVVAPINHNFEVFEPFQDGKLEFDDY